MNKTNNQYWRMPAVYPLTDVRQSGLSHAAQVELLCAGGATLIQLREKYMSPREFYHAAQDALQVARRYGARLLINDRADLTLALGADGVHVGQADLPPDAARQVLGENALIGFSTHSVEQALAAARSAVDYIAVGPVFATQSKENPDPVLGLEGLRQVRAALGAAMPLVAIGGITLENAPSVWAAGADSVAIIGALWGQKARADTIMRAWLAARELIDIIEDNP